MIEPPAADPADPDLPEQLRVRRAKRDRLLADGVEPYPVGFQRTTTLGRLRAAYPELPPDTVTGERVAVTGRVIFMRNAGKLCFATLRDGDGSELQAMLSLEAVGPAALERWKQLVDIGDHVGVSGQVVTSKRGELSVLADAFELTSKALRPLPVAHKPMAEETRIRQRYADLIVRPEARDMVRIRAAAVHAVREVLIGRGFVEVETPILQAVKGGAAARPFVTHYNAFDVDVYLRIAPELFLKRCVVGGLERVFELGRDFRNEGVDSTHSPEFTMLEAYEAYADYTAMADLTRELYQSAAIAAYGSATVRRFDGTELDLSGSWPVVPFYRLLSEAVGEQVGQQTPRERLAELAVGLGLTPHPAAGPARLAEDLFEARCQPELAGPIFVTDFPLATSPLTRAHRSAAGLAEKWDLVIGGVERATGYSELIDPVDQRNRLVEQARAAAAGDPEAMALDEDFLRALEYGMPPTGGLGLGIDRMLQVFTGRGIRETILFPFVRPE